MPLPPSAAFLSAVSILTLANPGSHAVDPHGPKSSTEAAWYDASPACAAWGNSNTPTISTRDVPLLGGNVTLTCVYRQASLRPPDDALHYHWFKDGQAVAGQQSGTLTLHNLSCSDQADYTCRASHTLTGTLSCTSGKHTVIVMVSPEVFIEEGGNVTYSIVEGNDLILTCRVSNDPRPIVKKGGFGWIFHKLAKGKNSTSPHDLDERILGSRGDIISNHGAKEVTNQLTIQSVTRLHSGLYTCHVTNDPDNSRGIPAGTASVEVQVQYLNSSVLFSLAPGKLVVTGDEVILTCIVDSVPTANLTWLHQGRILRTVESNEDVYSFPATGCQDSGEYQCRADNEMVKTSVTSRTSLLVQCAPAMQGSSHSEQSRFLGEELTLSVFSSGIPSPVYTWSGPRLKTGQGLNKLTLPHLQRDQAGVYTVNVSNEHGWFSLSFNVTVQHRDHGHNVTVQHRGKQSGDGPAVQGDSQAELTLWLKVGGGVLAALSCLAFVLLIALRKRRSCCQRNQSDTLRSSDIQKTEFFSRHHCDSHRERGGQEMTDYASGESSVQYWSIDSADLSCQPQAVQPQDSLSQAPPELHYDAPPAPRRHPAPTPGHGGAQPSSDVTNTDYITPCHDGGNNAKEDLLPINAVFESEVSGESDQGSDNCEEHCL